MYTEPDEVTYQRPRQKPLIQKLLMKPYETIRNKVLPSFSHFGGLWLKEDHFEDNWAKLKSNSSKDAKTLRDLKKLRFSGPTGLVFRD